MRVQVSSVALALSASSLVKAAAYDRQQEGPPGRQNLASGLVSMLNRIGGGGGQTITETVRHTITVGHQALVHALNATSAVTVTVTAPASTVTFCPPGQAQGAVVGASTSAAAGVAAGAVAGTTLPVVEAHGGVGVTVVSVPVEDRKTSQVQNPPAVTQSAVSSIAAGASSSLAALPGLSSSSAAAGSSLAALPTPPGLSTTASSAAALSSASPSSPPIVGAPVSDGSAAASATSLAALPGLASSLSDTLSLAPTGNAAAATPVADPAGAFGGVAGVIPISSAAVVPLAATTPAIANGADAGPTINVSGLTLTSQLNLGKLASPTAST